MLKRVLAIWGLVALPACGSTPSTTTHAFLQATRDADLATLATVSTVGWPTARVEPSEMVAWWVIRVADSEVTPFTLEDRQRRLTNARESRDARLGESEEEDDAELERVQGRVERLREQIDREREEARKSVETWSAIDGLDGSVETRRVEVVVRSRAGDYRYALTLKRYGLIRPMETRSLPSRWIVTDVEALGELSSTAGTPVLGALVLALH